MKLTKKLFIGIMTLALVVVTFTTSTFAWFTIGTTGEIKDVQVNVTAGTGMEISREGSSWKNVIELENPTTLKFTAVTTLDGKTFYDAEHGQLDLQNGTVGKNYMYYEQSFFVRIRKDSETGSSITKVLLSDVSGNHPADTESTDWTADVTLGTALDTENPVYTHYKNGNTNDDAIIEGATRTFDALNAVKVAFSTQRTVSNETTDTVTVFYGYESSTTSWGTMPAVNGTSHEVVSGLAYDYAEAKGYDMTKVQPGTIDSTSETVVFPTYVDYTSTKENITSTELGKVTVLSNASGSSDFVSADAAKATGGILENKTLDDGYIYAKVTIRIWLDGWDPDCINAILAQQTKFTFKLKAE